MRLPFRFAGLVAALLAAGCTPVPGPPCRTNADCDDGVACNGAELCVARQCWRPPAVVCDDGVACTVDTCEEPDGSCLFSPDDDACDDGTFCNGAETCDPVSDCIAGPRPTCDDGVGCTSDRCDPPSDACVSMPHDGRCNDDVFCNGREVCDVVLDCRPGTPPTCDDGVGCTVDACDAALDSCVRTPDDGLCQDGQFCTADWCHVRFDCRHRPLDCDDTVGCTTDSCDDDIDECVHEPDPGACPEPPVCHVAVCDPFSDCGAEPIPDGADCEPAPGVPGVCLGGVCVERRCGDGYLEPNEECDPGLHRIGCSADCTTFDFVVSDDSPAGGDDGREELAPADRAVAVLDGGDRFVVAWTQDRDLPPEPPATEPDYADVVARVVDVGEGVVSLDIPVAVGAMPQEKPIVAGLPGGGFVVAWHGYDPGGTGDDVDVNFAVCGVVVTPAAGEVPAEVTATCGPRIRANSTTEQAQLNPSLAVSASTDRIILAWEDWSPYGEGIEPWNLSGIRYRLFDLDGYAAPDFATDQPANTSTADIQAEPSVAALDSGEFIIAWSDASGAAEGSDGFEVRARIFDPLGDPTAADDFVVNLDRMTYEQYEPTTAPVEAPVPGFLAAWTSMEDLGGLTVRANFVQATGVVTATIETTLPMSVGGNQFAPTTAADNSSPTGAVVAVVWTAEPGPSPDGVMTGIAGVQVAIGCADCDLEIPSSDDVLLNTTSPDVQEIPAAAFGASGALALVWTDWSGADGSGGLNEVRARYLPQGWVLP